MDEQTGVIRAVIVHSPLVGPSTVRPLAASLQRRGWSTTVPDLRDAVESPKEYRRRAANITGAIDVVVGHSGAGPFLPIIAHDVHCAATVFVDAVVPDEGRSFRPGGRFVELLDAIPTDDGLLAPWHQWWPPEVMAHLIPDG